MSKDYVQLTKDLTAQLTSLRSVAPMKGFTEMAAEGSKTGAIDEKTKEFVALAIGVTQRCDACIGFHVKKLVQLGATKEEIAEVLATCTYMGGGPALMYAADAWKAYEQFSGK